MLSHLGKNTFLGVLLALAALTIIGCTGEAGISSDADGGGSIDAGSCGSGDAGACPNVDECALGTDDCASGFTCRDTDAGWSCDDIDECAMGLDDCDPAAFCANNDGGFTCGGCPVGTTDVNGDGTLCSDTDGCTPDPCFAGVACTDVPAPGTGATCGSCPSGTMGDGFTCTDTNGCMVDPCFAGVACTDVPAPGTGATCGSCPSGMIGDGFTCSDIDGCSGDPCGAMETCMDVPAPGTGHMCTGCPSGTMGDGVTCLEIDGCVGDPCDSLTACSDVPAPGNGFSCTSCPGGYNDVGGNGTNCVDWNECMGQDGGDDCDLVATCTNTPGSFTCTCPGGTTDVNGDGTDCQAPMAVCGDGTCDATETGTNCFQDCNCTLQYDIATGGDAALRINPGIGNTTRDIGPGTIRLRVASDSAGVPVDGTVELLYYDMDLFFGPVSGATTQTRVCLLQEDAMGNPDDPGADYGGETSLGDTSELPPEQANISQCVPLSNTTTMATGTHVAGTTAPMQFDCYNPEPSGNDYSPGQANGTAAGCMTTYYTYGRVYCSGLCGFALQEDVWLDKTSQFSQHFLEDSASLRLRTTNDYANITMGDVGGGGTSSDWAQTPNNDRGWTGFAFTGDLNAGGSTCSP